MYKQTNTSLAQYALRISAYALPLLQIFGSMFIDTNTDVIKFGKILPLIAATTAVLGYVAVIALRYNYKFEWSLSKKKRQNYYTYLSRIDKNTFSQDEIKAYISKHDSPARPRYITNRNVHLLTIPIMSVCLTIFAGIGIGNTEFTSLSIQVTQVFFYMLLVVTAAAQLALSYAESIHIERDNLARQHRLEKLENLLAPRGGVTSPNIEIISTYESEGRDGVGELCTRVKIGDKPYIMTSDLYADWLMALHPDSQK